MAALEAVIQTYLEHHDADPRPFVWTADADLILNRIKRISERTSNSGHEQGIPEPPPLPVGKALPTNRRATRTKRTPGRHMRSSIDLRPGVE
jgi:hypothetical protein